MMHPKSFLCAAAVAALLAGCQSTAKPAANRAPDSVVGGVIGSKIGGPPDTPAAGDVGSLLGAYMGKPIAASIAASDQPHAAEAARRAYAAPVGELIGWNNPVTGHSGTVTSTRAGYNNKGEYCREYQQTVTADGQKEMAFGTACKLPDGTWKLVD
ncbi:RT0821/Lpp0805 family surface protein [Azospirillum sp. ST 5-10]|uniref:RT0821/Lpp0805 family surface protein n=1 Tax=unclassified Azospirillum TaxID=2630922 RepID=UPI003F49CBA9